MSDDNVDRTVQHQADDSLMFYRDGCPYNKASVMVVYWKEDDFQPSCADESQKVVSLFRDDFHYEVKTFAIPMENSQNHLTHAVSGFMLNYDHRGNLIVLYYSGHGDKAPNSNKPIWAALRVKSNSELDWSLIQPQLMHAKADVLFIFDCCYAATAAKAREEGGGIELLAASPSGGQTPGPGDSSFTHSFVEETRKALHDKEEVRVSDLVCPITKRTRQDPVHILLRGTSRLGILLRPMIERGNLPPKMDPAAIRGGFSVTMLLKKPPDNEVMRELGEWVKSTAPPTVTAVRIDKLISLSCGLHDFILKEGRAGIDGKLLDTLRDEDRDAVFETLCRITQVAAFPFLGKKVALITAKDRDEILRAWEEQLEKLSRSIWGVLHTHPEFQETAKLEDLEKSEAARQAGVSTAARLQLLARNLRPLPVSDIHFWEWKDISYTRPIREATQYVTASVDGKMRIIEIIRLSHWPSMSVDERKNTLNKVISLLSSDLPNYFQVCQCLGFTADPKKEASWAGLIFEFPPGMDRLWTLKEYFQRTHYMPLEHRYLIAHQLAQSVMGLHSIGWVHQGIRGDNMLFFQSKNASNDDIASTPWLFGFEHARDSSLATRLRAEFRMEKMVYTPPSRWGNPSEKFSYLHDWYALGVVLIEIAYWKPILKLRPKLQTVSSAIEAQEILLDLAQASALSHLMGTQYAQAAISCLTAGPNCGGDALPEFERKIVDSLEALLTMGRHGGGERCSES